jgi:phosphoribosylformylglycinamidine cyclo-ligase
MSMTYKQAGVDVDKQNTFIEEIKPIIKSTFGPEVMGGIGGFSGLFRFNQGNYKDPILVSSTDGVGTKLKIAFMADRHDTVGIDLVAMVVNDIIVGGAQPLFLLDYFATGKLNIERDKQIISGIAEGCRDAGCALIGGETAEMPCLYKEDEYDLAAFGVGVVESDKHINGSLITRNDILIGINSSGLHSNGFSLARKVLLEKSGLKIDSYVPELGKVLADELLTPTKIYVKNVLNLFRDFEIKGIVHVTGGGFIDNIPRILPERSSAIIEKALWEIPPVFSLIQKLGGIEEQEMFRTFNMGIGMILFVGLNEADDILVRLKGLKLNAQIIGVVDHRKDGPPVSIVE